MKPALFTTLVFTILFVPAFSQNISLNELLKKMIPDATSNTLAADWKAAPPQVKWQTAIPRKIPVGYLKTGTASVLLPGQQTSACSVDLSGKTIAGYNEISLSLPATTDTGENVSYDAQSLFGKTDASFKLIRKDESGFPMYDYQVIFPGKKTAWMMIMMDSGAAGSGENAAITMIVLFDKAEFERRTSF